MINEYILADDVEHIKQRLDSFEGYYFSQDISERMSALGLTKSELAKRVNTSHTTVGKWLKGTKPHGKERFKELGMALGMSVAELNSFLCRNCYPGLYAKNPLDMLCKFVLDAYGRADIIERYRNLLKQYGLDKYVLKEDDEYISTNALSVAFTEVKSITSFEKWLLNNDRHFKAYDKNYVPNMELVRFILLYIGEQSINDMFVAGELPVAIRNMLYPLIGEKEVAVKGLRAKLIVFGLYKNMTEDEIDMMLETAGLLPLSQPATRLDNALLISLRCAHERFPYYELNNAQNILISLSESDELYTFYKEKEKCAADCVKYYEADGKKSGLERLFEETYTDYNGSGILQYTTDIFSILNRDNVLTEAETSEYTSLLQTYQ